MKLWKRAASLLLVLVLLVGLIPVPAQAADMEKVNVENEQFNVEGTNDFGQQIGEKLSEQQATEEETNAFGVTGLEITGNEATVEYGALEPAIAVVAIYTEDGRQMLLSGKAEADPNKNKVTVTLAGEMPQYFMAMAYMADVYDYSPLCPAYETPMYTREMQELLASTTDDFAPEDVLNLDDDKTTNFAVYAESTVVIEEKAGANTVASADYANNIYVIENADAAVTDLQVGNVVAYPYGQGELIITRVDKIQVSGSTVTITGSDVDLEEAFAQVKVENEANTQDMTVSDEGADEGVQYLGISEGDPNAPAPSAVDIGGGASKSFTFELSKEVKGDRGKASAKGKLGLELSSDLKLYISIKRQYLEFKVDIELGAKVDLKGRVDIIRIKLGAIDFSPCSGVFIGFKPAAVLRFNVTVNLEVKYAVTFGIQFSPQEKNFVKSLCSPGRLKGNVKVDGTIYIGLDMNPRATVLSEKTLSMSMTCQGGLKIKGTMPIVEEAKKNPTKIHNCKACIAFKNDLQCEFSGKLALLTKEWEIGHANFSFHLGDAYFSVDKMKFGWGECPNVSYRVTVVVMDDASGDPMPNIPVIVKTEEGNVVCELGTTDSSGAVRGYFPKGKYIFEAVIDEESYSIKAKIRRAQRVTICKKATQPDESFGSMVEGGVSDGRYESAAILYSGYCGFQGDPVTWTLYGNGKLLIRGYGMAAPVYYLEEAPWARVRDLIKTIVIEEGVTGITGIIFEELTNLTSVTLPESMQVIGFGTFRDCTSLTSVTIPKGVTIIGMGAFSGCTSLTSLTLSEGLRTIDGEAFRGCTSLTSVTIPASVEEARFGVFQDCTSLMEVKLSGNRTYFDPENMLGTAWLNAQPKGLVYLDGYLLGCTEETLEGAVEIRPGTRVIGNYAFQERTGITSVIFPESLRTIGSRVFENCTGLTSVTIPEGVTTIGDETFSGCTNLANVSFPNSVTSIGRDVLMNTAWEEAKPSGLIYNGSCLMGYHRNSPQGVLEIRPGTRAVEPGAFSGCSGLTSVTLPEGLTTIGEGAFSGCSGVTSVTLPKSLTTIGKYAFSGCSGLTSVTLPEGLTTIGGGAFSGCSGLTSVTLPEGLTTIGEMAFQECTGLTSAMFPKGLTTIGGHAFSGCSGLTNVTLPEGLTTISEGAFASCYGLSNVIFSKSVTAIMEDAFSRCSSLTSVTFCGNAPKIVRKLAFGEVQNVSAYYPAGDSTWTPENTWKIGDRTWTWTAYTPGTRAAAPMKKVELVAKKDKPAVKPFAVFDGEYDTVKDENNQIIKTASFKNLVPGQEYLLLAMLDLQATEHLAAENLLYIRQAKAAEDGTLSFTYIQRVPSDTSYVVACGASNKNLKDAQITFPAMTARAVPMQVLPTVVWKGTTLQEGLDYVVSGQVDYTEPGIYTCYVRGIRAYTGLVKCEYTVTGTAATLPAPTVKLSINASSGRPTLSWNAIEGAREYEIWRRTGKTGQWSCQWTTTKTSYTNTTAEPGVTYYYQVRAMDVNGVKGMLSPVRYLTCDCARPGVEATIKNGLPYLTWQSIKGAKSYEIWRSTNGGEFLKQWTTTKTTYTNTSAKSGNTYTYKIKALCAKSSYGDGAFSYEDTVKLTAQQLPAPVVKLSLSPGSGRPALSWNAIAGAKEYQIWRRVGKDGQWARQWTTTKTSYTNTTAEPGVTYYYQVRAMSESGEKGKLSPVRYLTCDCARPGVTATLKNGLPYLTWQSIKGAKGYEIWRSTNGGEFYKQYTTTRTSYTNTSAKPGNTYRYKIRALCAKSSYGNGAFSYVDTVTVK